MHALARLLNYQRQELNHCDALHVDLHNAAPALIAGQANTWLGTGWENFNSDCTAKRETDCFWGILHSSRGDAERIRWR